MTVTERTGSSATIEGKTYTLYGSGASAGEYYKKIGALADRVLEQDHDITAIIAAFERLSRKKRFLRKEARARDPR